MYRKRVGLSQQEVAQLVGVSQDANVTKHELGRQLPSVRVLIAYEVVYGEPLAKLFAGLYEEVEACVQDRAKELLAEIEDKGEHPRPRKFQQLSEICFPDDTVIVPWEEN